MPRRKPRREPPADTPTDLTLTRTRTGALGRRTVLTRHTRDTICDALRKGNAITTAAATAGVSRGVIFQWLSDGQTAQDDIAAGRPVTTERALACLDFLDHVTRARAKAETDAVDVIQDVMRGGQLISEEPALSGDGLPIYDEDGNLTYKRVYAQADGRLALEFISRSNPGKWGKRSEGRLEIVGDNGLPVGMGPGEGGPTIESGAALESLANRLHLVAARHADVVEGEVVEATVDEDEPGTDVAAYGS